MHIINMSNCTLCSIKIFIGFDTLFWPIFADFQNEAAGLCVNNSANGRFPQRGRQRECHNSFLIFPSKKLTAKIYHKRLTGQFMR